MTKPIEKTIVLRAYGYGDKMDGYSPHGLAEAIDILQESLLEIPSEYRASAEVDFSAEYSYGETYDQLQITYSRLETPDEADIRGALDREHAEKWIADQEALIRRRKAELAA